MVVRKLILSISICGCATALSPSIATAALGQSDGYSDGQSGSSSGICLGADLPEWFCHISRLGTGTFAKTGIKILQRRQHLELAWSRWLTHDITLGTVHRMMRKALRLDQAQQQEQPGALRSWVTKASSSVQLSRQFWRCSNHPAWEGVTVTFNLRAYLQQFNEWQFSDVQWLPAVTENWRLAACAPLAWGHVAVNDTIALPSVYSSSDHPSIDVFGYSAEEIRLRFRGTDALILNALTRTGRSVKISICKISIKQFLLFID